MVVPCGEEQHGGPVARGPQRAAYLNAVPSREPNVQDHDCGRMPCHRREGRVAVALDQGRKTGPLQVQDHEVGDRRLVLDDENEASIVRGGGHGHPATLGGAARA